MRQITSRMCSEFFLCRVIRLPWFFLGHTPLIKQLSEGLHHLHPLFTRYPLFRLLGKLIVHNVWVFHGFGEGRLRHGSGIILCWHRSSRPTFGILYEIIELCEYLCFIIAVKVYSIRQQRDVVRYNAFRVFCEINIARTHEYAPNQFWFEQR